MARNGSNRVFNVFVSYTTAQILRLIQKGCRHTLNLHILHLTLYVLVTWCAGVWKYTGRSGEIQRTTQLTWLFTLSREPYYIYIYTYI